MVWGQPERLGFDLLRQLALGLSTYRLYPGELEQPAFVTASERIRDAAEAALAAGAVHFDLRAGRFHTEDGVAVDDEHAQRLASAAFARGVEHLHVRAVPTVEELAATFEVLSLPEERVAQAYGGADALLRSRGITAISVGAIAPEAGDPGALPLDQLTPAQLDVWEEFLQPEQLIDQALIDTDGLSNAARADQVYKALKRVESELPRRFGVSAEFAEGVERVVQALPKALRREFAALAMARASADPMAERYLNHLTDAELVQLLELVAEGGADPIDLARRLQQVVGRQATFVDLADAMFGRAVPSSTDVAQSTRPTLAALAADADESKLKPAVADLVAQRYVATGAAEADAIRAAYPASVEELRAAGLAAFRDYVQLIEPGPMLDGPLESWRMRLREALSNRDVRAVARLVDTIATIDAEGEKQRAIKAATKRVLDPELIADMAQWAREDGEIDDVRGLLATFDAAAVDGLLDALAAEEDRGRRAVMLGMVSDLGHGYSYLVAERLADERWYVVRNAVTILGRIGGDGALSALVRAGGHHDPRVRREVVRSLVSAAGADAVPYLARLGDDPDEAVSRAAVGALAVMSSDAAVPALATLARNGPTERRRQALEALATSTLPTAIDALRALGSRSSRPRLPWSLRRFARRLAREEGRP